MRASISWPLAERTNPPFDSTMVAGSLATSSRFVDGLRGLALDDLRAAVVAVLRGVRFDLAGDELLELRLRLENAFELFAFLGELLLLVADLHLFELGEVAQLGFEDRLGLDLGELEALHEHGLGLVLAPDDADHLVEIEIRRQQAIEDVQALGDLVEPELQPARDGGGAERQPLVEQVAQAHHLGLALERDHVDVHAIVALEIRGREQVRHELRRRRRASSAR